MQPFLSVSIITYNHASFIGTCLESIVTQNVNFEFEILIHDDASTDGTRQIIEKYMERFPNVIFPIFQTENQYSKGIRGFMPRFNFPRARGKYIALCEGDDYWIGNDKLQKQVDFLESNQEFSGSYHDTQVVYQNNLKEPHLFRATLPSNFNAADTIAQIAPFHTSSFIFKKEAFQDADWFYKIKSGDMAIFTIVASNGILGYVPNLMSCYRKHETGITNSELITNTYHQDRIDLMQHFDKLHNYKYSQKVAEVISFHQMKIDGVKPKQVSALQKMKTKIIRRLT